MSAAADTMRTPDLRLIHLPKAKALEEFDALAPFIAMAAEVCMGRISLESIHKGISDGLMMPFLILDLANQEIKAVILTEANGFPHKRVFNLALCGGADVDQWAHFYQHFKKLAADMGFDQIEVTGRPGWARVLGLKPQTHTFVEDLTDGQPDAEDAG